MEIACAPTLNPTVNVTTAVVDDITLTSAAAVLYKNKRKAIPIRSPHCEHALATPGVVFQFPIGLEDDDKKKEPIYTKVHVVFYPKALAEPHHHQQTNNLNLNLEDFGLNLNILAATSARPNLQTSSSSKPKHHHNNKASSKPHNDDFQFKIHSTSMAPHSHEAQHQHLHTGEESESQESELQLSGRPKRNKVGNSFYQDFQRGSLKDESEGFASSFTSDDSSSEDVGSFSSSDEPRKRSKMLGKNSLLRKVCASCGTSKTPYWRDGWNCVPLCNACGIRYQKYRTKCQNCMYIPRKEDVASAKCAKCNYQEIR